MLKRLRTALRSLRLVLPAIGAIAIVAVLIGTGRLAPVLGGLTRALLHPVTLGLIAAIVVLARLRRPGKSGSSKPPTP